MLYIFNLFLLIGQIAQFLWGHLVFMVIPCMCVLINLLKKLGFDLLTTSTMYVRSSNEFMRKNKGLIFNIDDKDIIHMLGLKWTDHLHIVVFRPPHSLSQIILEFSILNSTSISLFI